MDDKILQIIPAPAGLLAHFTDFNEDGSDGYIRPVCLALVARYSGGIYRTEVRAMLCGPEDDFIDFDDDCSNFQGLCFRPERS